jgi:hypothetical protein
VTSTVRCATRRTDVSLNRQPATIHLPLSHAKPSHTSFCSLLSATCQLRFGAALIYHHHRMMVVMTMTVTIGTVQLLFIYELTQQ